MHDFRSVAASFCLTEPRALLLLHVLPASLMEASVSAAVTFLRVDLRLAFGRHGKEKDGLLARSSLAPRLVLASPRQSHKHGWVLPGAVRVVVVALQPL